MPNVNLSIHQGTPTALQSTSTIPRSFQFALFFTGLFWIVAAATASTHAAQGIVTRLNLAFLYDLLHQLFFAFLLMAGFTAINWVATRGGGIRSTNALPSRATSSQEFLRGAALGWGILLLTLVPLMLTGSLHPALTLVPSAIPATTLSLASLLLYTLTLELAFRGFLFTRLIAAIGPVTATILLALLDAFISTYRPNSTALSFAIAFVAALVFALAYLRTHALWLSWGLHFAWLAATAILFGLPLASDTTHSTFIFTDAYGADWFTGGLYGPQGSFITFVVLLAAIPVLYRITRNYAWDYTHPAIVAAAYEVVITPPAAHTAMEAAAAPAPLVQILAATPTAASTMPVIDDHLRTSQFQTDNGE